MKKKKEKKKYAEPEMGYCLFEHWLGRTRRLGTHRERACGVGGHGRSVQGALGARQAGRGARACEARGRQAGARSRQAGSGRARQGAQGARRARGVQARGLCAPGRAGWAVGYALGALSLFLARFDSVLFLSQFLDIVCEPGS